MSLNILTSKMNGARSRSRLGTVVTVGGVRKVNVDGNVLTCTWADPMIVDDGDPVNVEFTTAGIGQSKAHVSSRSTAQPRPRTGRVTQVPAGSPTIKVEALGVTYDAEQVAGPYSQDDVVHLDWGAGRPRVIGKSTMSVTEKPPAVIAPPTLLPAEPRTGYQSGAAIGARTYWVGDGWGTYAGDGNKVHQGTYNGVTLTGAWFYGTQFRNLIGRQVTRIQFRTGDRLAVGANGEPATFHFYAHTNPSQPDGDTNRVAGPFEWTATPGQAPTWIDLPPEFGQYLIDGGGVAIAGDPFAAMQGTTVRSPESGALILDWSY